MVGEILQQQAENSGLEAECDPSPNGKLDREGVSPGLRQANPGPPETQQIAILTDLQEIASLWFTQRAHGPVVNHQYVDATGPNQ